VLTLVPFPAGLHVHAGFVGFAGLKLITCRINMSNPVVLNAPSMVAYTPAETIELVSRAGARKGRARPDKVFLGAVSAGCMLSLAAGGSLLVTAIPWYIENAPGLVKMLSALIFPVALVLIMLTGGELFTGSTMITGVAVLHRRLPIPKMLLHWFLCFWGNFAGCLFVMSIFMGCKCILVSLRTLQPESSMADPRL